MAAWLPGSLVVMDLVEDAAALGGERAVVRARRPTGVGGRKTLLAAAALRIVADDEIALRDVDLLPVVVHERLGGVRAGLDLEESRAAAALFHFVEIGGEDLLVEPRRVARRPLPARIEIDADEFQVLLRFHADLLHASLVFASCSMNSSIATARSPEARSSRARSLSCRKPRASKCSNNTSLTRRWYGAMRSRSACPRGVHLRSTRRPSSGSDALSWMPRAASLFASMVMKAPER